MQKNVKINMSFCSISVLYNCTFLFCNYQIYRFLLNDYYIQKFGILFHEQGISWSPEIFLQCLQFTAIFILFWKGFYKNLDDLEWFLKYLLAFTKILSYIAVAWTLLFRDLNALNYFFRSSPHTRTPKKCSFSFLCALLYFISLIIFKIFFSRSLEIW